MPTADRHLTPERRAVRDQRRATFGRRLREVRVARGLSQEAVANAAAIDRRFLVDVELAKQSITVDRLWDVAAALDVDVRELLAPPADEASKRAEGEDG